MSYTDLKYWCVNNDLYNPILESRIIYDSVFSEVLDEFGYSYDRYMYDENYTIDEETVFEVFKERMISQYSDYINISEDYDEEYGAEYYIEPLLTDGFDELIVMNDKNIVIVGISVYKLIGDIILSTSVFDFNEEIANLMSTREFGLYLMTLENRGNISYTDSPLNSNASNFLPLQWVARGNRTKMKVKLRAFDFPNWKGEIIRHARLSVNNYRYGCWRRVYTTIDAYASLMARGDLEESYTFAFIDEGNFYSKTCKDKYMKYTPVVLNSIYLTYITGYVENHWGLSINFNSIEI